MSASCDGTNRNGFKARAAAVRMPDETRAAILAAIEAERRLAVERPLPARPAGGAATAVAVDGANAGRPGNSLARSASHLVTRRRVLAIAACTGALVVGGAALRIWLASRPTDDELRLAAENGGFVLRAYAEGAKVDGADKTVVSDTLVTSYGGWSESESENGYPKDVSVQWDLDLSCLGEGVRSVLIAFPENGPVSLRHFPERAETHGDYSGNKEAQRFTLTMREMTRDTLAFGFTLPYDAELKAAYDAYQNAEAELPSDWASRTKDEDERSWGNTDAYSAAIDLAAAKVLATTELTMQAELSDGRSVTHVYRFDPVEDFTDVALANSRAIRTPYDDTPLNPLVTITQLR